MLRSVIGIIFPGTPHRGSEVANLDKTIGTIVNISSTTASAGTQPRIIRTDLLDHLNSDSNVLHELALAARNRLENMAVVSFHETEPTPPLSVLVRATPGPSKTLSCTLKVFISAEDSVLWALLAQDHSWNLVDFALHLDRRLNIRDNGHCA